MDYFALHIKINPFNLFSDILISELAELGFESFDDSNPPYLIAFSQVVLFDKYKTEKLLNEFKLLNNLEFIEYSVELIKSQNWNESWESSFHPIFIDDKIVVRAPFHPNPKGFEYDVLIQPKMSFGTGHHETTFMMMKNMLNFNFHNRSVLDMGTGTGVLAVLAHKLGAVKIDTYDIDDWSIANAIENFQLNGCNNISIRKADIEDVDSRIYDFILANINKNVLTIHISFYSQLLKESGVLMLSGFFESDIESLEKLCNLNKLYLENKSLKNTWACLTFIKKA